MPSARPVGAKVQTPVTSAVAVPRTAVPSFTVTIELPSAVPVKAASAVMLSVANAPLSVTSATVGAGGVVSNVKAKSAFAERLPATSVCRTRTDLAPSPVSVRLEPAPVNQLVPPSVEYCHEDPDSSPLTLTVPMLVILSEDDAPVSEASVKTGVATLVSNVMDRLAEPIFPALSVWLTIKV